MLQNQTVINLDSLIELSGKLYESDDPDFILNSTLLSLMGKLKFARGAYLLYDEGGGIYSSSLKGFPSNQNMDDIFSGIDLATEEEIFFPDNDNFTLGTSIKVRNSNKAFILLGKRFVPEELAIDESKYAHLVSKITSNALQNSQRWLEIKNKSGSLEQANQLLRTIFEIGRDFSAILSKEEILRLLSLNLMGQVVVSRFAVVTIDESGAIEELVNRFEDSFKGRDFSKVHDLNKSSSIYNLELDSAALEFCERNGIKIISPMITQRTVKGYLLVGKKMNSTDFTKEDEEFIFNLGNSAITAIENERLFREELEKKRIEGELELALEIQRNLLPKSAPEFEGYEIFGNSIPSRHVAGDYFDFITLDENRLMVIIADVSGKGIPASLIMANLQSALRLLSKIDIGLKDIVLKVNDLLYRNTSADKFVTAFFGILDKKENYFTYINAGHNPPFLLKSDGSFDTLHEGGILLGFLEKPFEYSQGYVSLEKNDLLTFYTDGITELQDSVKEEYGEDRLEKFLKTNNQIGVEELSERLLQNLRAYANGKQNDDITYILLKVK